MFDFRKKSVDTKNKRIIYKIVKNHFGLSQDSLKLFKHNLYFERDVPKEYEFIHKENDLRVIYQIDDYFDEDSLRNIYPDYDFFVCNFRNQINKYNITYQDYKNNSITYEKNNYKLIKFLFKDKVIDYIKESLLNDKLSDNITKEINSLNQKTTFKKIVNLISNLREDKSLAEKLEKLDYNINYINDIVNNIIKIKGSKENNLKLVISRNFTDFLLCSTSQKFKSCLNLESDHCGAYWTGLPGTITDKNRAMIYITNGESVNYEGIIGPKIINRSWILTERFMYNKKREIKAENFLQIVKNYPSNGNYNNFKILLEKLFPKYNIINRSFCTNNKLIGKYYFDPLWFKDDYLCFIYMDSTEINKGRKNKAKNKDLLYYNRCTQTSGYESFHKLDTSDTREFEYGSGLRYLMSTNLDVVDENKNAENYAVCEYCDERNAGVIYRDFLNGCYCDSCYEEKVDICDSCGSEVYSDNACYHNDSIYCEDCFHDKYFSCDHCGNNHDIDKVILIHNNYNGTYEVCEDCLDNYNICENCGEYFTNDAFKTHTC